MSVPYWRHTPSPRHLHTHILIIGSGICGLSAAHELAARNIPFLIAERHTLGSGASTRNAGFLMRGMAENYVLAIRDHGRQLAQTMWRWTEENLEIQLSRGVSTLPSFRPIPSCLLALEPIELEELRRSLSLLHADGFKAQWLDTHHDSAWPASKPLGALVNPGDAAVNPWELIAHLARPLAPFILEHQAALAFEPSTQASATIAARTADTVIHAQRILVCTNAYASLLLPSLTPLISPKRGQMLAIRPDSPYRLDFSYYSTRGSEYFRQTPDGTIVVGGKRTSRAAEECGYDDSPTPALQHEIERFARTTLALTGPVIARWAGTMGFSKDALPLIGPIPNPDLPPGLPPDSLWFCGGFTGHGMSLAARSARAVIAHMLDNTPSPFPLSRFPSSPACGGGGSEALRR